MRPVRGEDELAKGRVVIVAGYQGMSYKREITTLGRGGSDTTALALAAASATESCGNLLRRARRIQRRSQSIERQKIDEASYDELLTLARYGARVLRMKRSPTPATSY